MATSAEHKTQAEHHLAIATEALEKNKFGCFTERVALAQVHATLAGLAD
ncbi:hypothetical protein [Tsukamurella strandjordii]|uniref:Uncharacterized protein n=1 Tax=Tsukamurella strandjordii TaxID=147577 RepID=A0AA90SMG1_9ACTN|nr:hypothetical protein [Tsukamurella strandjordii]MDP0399188.1 hypothetical protein [Tsukamurella strandjordii]